jgi:hypothetical protein
MSYLTPLQQIELFAGCVYVTEQHKVFVPKRGLLKPAQFNAAFGGHVFEMDNVGQRLSRNAWVAFTQSEALRPPIVDDTISRPDLTVGTVFEYGGRRYVVTNCA